MGGGSSKGEGGDGLHDGGGGSGHRGDGPHNGGLEDRGSNRGLEDGGGGSDGPQHSGVEDGGGNGGGSGPHHSLNRVEDGGLLEDRGLEDRGLSKGSLDGDADGGGDGGRHSNGSNGGSGGNGIDKSILVQVLTESFQIDGSQAFGGSHQVADDGSQRSSLGSLVDSVDEGLGGGAGSGQEGSENDLIIVIK